MWLQLALLEQGELFAQEEVLGSQCAARPGNEHEETDEIAHHEGQRGQQLEDGAGHERSALHVTRRYATANWRPGEISADHKGSSTPKVSQYDNPTNAHPHVVAVVIGAAYFGQGAG